MDLNEYKLIKIPYYLSHCFPIDKHFNYTVNVIEKTNIYKKIANSLIDDSPIYKLKDGVIRFLKIKKLLNDNTFHNKIIEMLEDIKDNIETIPIMDENYTVHIFKNN